MAVPEPKHRRKPPAAQPDTSPQALSTLIGLIYQGPLEAVPWASCLRWLTQHLHASWAVLVLRPASQERPSLIIQAHHQTVAISENEYILFDRYSSDPFTGLPADRILAPEEFIGGERWFNGEFFKEYLQPHDIHFQIGADFFPDQYSECRLRLCRPLAWGAFTAAERACCELLIPHFKRAVYLHSRLYKTEVERELYASTFDRMHVGTLIIGDDGTLLTANQAAEVILAERNGLWLSDGTLRAQQNSAQQALAAAIRAARTEGAGATFIKALNVPRTGAHADLKVLIKNIPLSQRVEGNRRPAVVVYIRDPERVFIPSTDILRMLFSFTPAEAALAKLLAEGLSLDEAGAALGISKNTGKSRLRAVFAKTGTTRQASLVRVLLDAIVSL